MSDFMSPGRRIRHYRMLRGMTQKALGIAAGFPPETADIRIAQYESGARTPKHALLCTLAEALGVSPLVLDMLNQAFSDRAKLSKLLNISDEQMSYVTNADAGCGLIKYGSALVPFINRFPKDTDLYRLMTTRPGEGVFGSGNAS